MRVRFVFAAVLWAFAVGFASNALSQTNYYTTNGTEYAIIGQLPGDQVRPDIAISTNGGYIVWQDNITDGSGLGVSAQNINSTLSGSLSTFRVNVQGTNDQENPRVALLKNGGAAFVWQGGLEGYQHIYARFLNASNIFLTSTDVPVSQFTANFQIKPAIATLNNSNVIIVWSSYDEVSSNSLQDVYGRIFSQSGVPVTSEFLINQFTNYNQRTPSVAAMPNGGFIVAWVSEQERVSALSLGTNVSGQFSASSVPLPSVDIYARLYQSTGVPVGNEFLVDTNSAPCANPSVASASDGSFLFAWSSRDMVNITNGWDVHARAFSSAGIGGPEIVLNTFLTYDQYSPRLSSIAMDYLAVWTSVGEDGSQHGVYGQFIHKDGTLIGGEFRVNATTLSDQIHPAIASDGVSQFLAVWTRYTGNPYSFDLFGQRYANVLDVLDALPAPFVYAPFVLSNNVYQPQLVVSWAPVPGLAVSNYLVYVDGSQVASGVVTTNQWTMTAANGLTASSTHSFEVSYVASTGTSPQSPPGYGTTWSGVNWHGVPYEWMQANFGNNTNTWPLANAPIASGGPTIYQAFLSGATINPATWLQQSLTQTSQGLFLSWNTQPGATYQVQQAADMVTWTNLGAARFASGTTDSIYVGGGAGGYYRVVLLRQ